MVQRFQKASAAVVAESDAEAIVSIVEVAGSVADAIGSVGDTTGSCAGVLGSEGATDPESGAIGAGSGPGAGFVTGLFSI